MRIEVSNSSNDDRRGGRMGRDNRRDNYDDPERTSGDWRSGPREDLSDGDSYRSRYDRDRFDNRDRRDDRESTYVLSNFTFIERNKFLKNYFTIEKLFIEQDTITITSQVHGVRETAAIKDPRLKTIGAASEMIAETETETGTGIVLAIEGEAETETETGAAVSGHVAIMVILIGTAIVVKIEMRSVSVQLFGIIRYMRDIVSLIKLLIFLFNYDNLAESRQRPKLQLQPRTKPVEPIVSAEDSAAKDGTTESTANSESTQRAPAATSVPATNIFGAAKPVDTTAREREIEERLAKSYAESRSREETYVYST